MKKFNFSLAVLIASFVLLFSFNNSVIKAQSRAVKGDTVWVLLNNIKHNKKQEFEKFIYEIFWPKAAMLDINEQQAFKHTRVLNTVKMNEDSTYTYIFLMDPVLPNKSYDILYYLKKMYGEKKAKKYFEMWNECLSGPQIEYDVIQSQY